MLRLGARTVSKLHRPLHLLPQRKDANRHCNRRSRLAPTVQFRRLRRK